MTKEYSPDRLDVKAFAQAGGHLSRHDSLLKYERLASEAQGLHPLRIQLDRVAHWVSQGAQPSDAVKKLVKRGKALLAAKPEAAAQ